MSRRFGVQRYFSQERNNLQPKLREERERAKTIGGGGGCSPLVKVIVNRPIFRSNGPIFAFRDDLNDYGDSTFNR